MKKQESRMVSAAFVFHDQFLRTSYQMLLERYPLVKSCGVFSDIRSFCNSLRDGRRPRVIVLDGACIGPQIFAMREEIRQLETVYLPHFYFLSNRVLTEQEQNTLLTFLPGSVILKPCRPVDLMDYISLNESGTEKSLQYYLREACRNDLISYGADLKLKGTVYLCQMVCEGLADRRSKTMEELYAAVTEKEAIGKDGISSALYRLAERLYQTKAPGYLKMCRQNHLPTDRQLSNTELYEAVASGVGRMLD